MAIAPDWQTEDGSVRLYCGDCRDILPTLEGVDCVVTDPPYGLGDKWNGGAGGEKSSWNFASHHAKAWDMSTCDGVVQLSSASECVIWGGNYYPLPPSRCWFVWDKCQPDNWSTGQCELAWTNLDKPIRAFRMCQAVAHDEMRPKMHPAQKPASLMVWCLKWVKSLSVYDPYMGSGTTGVACVRTGKSFIGVEASRDYFDIAVERITKELERLRLFEPTPKIITRQKPLFTGDAE